MIMYAVRIKMDGSEEWKYRSHRSNGYSHGVTFKAGIENARFWTRLSHARGSASYWSHNLPYSRVNDVECVEVYIKTPQVIKTLKPGEKLPWMPKGRR